MPEVCIRHGCDWPVEFPQAGGVRCIRHSYSAWRIDNDPYDVTTIDYTSPDPRHRSRARVSVYTRIGPHEIVSGVNIEVGAGMA